MAATRDPDVIQKEIEQTRAELAETIDAIADRISPKRAAGRGAAAVKAQMTSVFNGSNGSPSPASVLDAPPSIAAKVDSEARREAIARIAREGGGVQHAGVSEFSVARSLRVDRILLLVGGAATVAALVVLRRKR